MPICVAGMHRSGTSMVARLLHEVGVYLGAESELIPPSQDNMDGYMENTRFVQINDELLIRLGGSWGNPPPTTLDDLEKTDIRDLRNRAEVMLQNFRGHEPWGWKDPRNSLTLSFWMSLIDGVKVVVCLRHPSQVARSLYRSRCLPPYTLNMTLWNMYSRLAVYRPRYQQKFLSHPLALKLLKVSNQLRVRSSSRQREVYTYLLGLTLWKMYNEGVLKHTAPEQRIITHYESFFDDPRAELLRLLDFLNIHASDEKIDRCCSTISTRLRRNHGNPCHPADSRVSSDVLRLYVRMCEEAGFAPS